MQARYILNIIALTAFTSIAYQAWDHPRSDAAKIGFVKVVTAPAVPPMQFAQVGELALGAGPAVAPDGTD